MSERTDFPPVRACLFDMDGLLIDSEDLYTKCTNIVLREYGKPDLPWSIKAQLQGRPAAEANLIFTAWANLPISPDEFRAKQSAHQRDHFPTTAPLPGIPTLLSTLSRATTIATPESPASKVHLALATSSHTANYRLKTAHLGSLFDVFPPEQRVLGDDPRIPPGKGKPSPDIYLLALETINARLRSDCKAPSTPAIGLENESQEREITPEECLVFEDSVPGVEAGRRAGMRVVWVPHPGLLKEYRGQEAEVLAGVAMSRPESADGSSMEIGGRPGTVGDGWGQLLETLEDFPYARYGMQV